MSKSQRKQMWVYAPTASKFTAAEKALMLDKIKTMVGKHPKISKKISRVDIRSNRIYLYELVEQTIPEGAILKKPLINDKYLEFPYARITMLDIENDKCSVDCQRYNDKWMTVFGGTLTECIVYIESDDVWF